MIRGYGKRGNLDDALQMTKQMEANGFTPSADSMCGLIDAHMIIKVSCFKLAAMTTAEARIFGSMVSLPPCGCANFRYQH
jgi:pentatricopeptide repeat protein